MPPPVSETTATSPHAELFLGNMRALWQRDPQLALRLDAIHDDQRVPLQATRSGAWTAVRATPSGADVYLHSRYDPVAEANRLVDAVDTDDKYCFVVSGSGLGYHVAALLSRLRGDAFIVCSEPDEALLATALTCVDLADAIGEDRLIFITDNDKPRLHRRLRSRNTLIMLGAQFVHHPPSLRIAESAHQAISAAIAEFVTYTRMTLVTLVSNSRITCENIAMNLARYMTTPPIDQLRNRFAGYPAIIVSAGPSLSRNIDQLAELKGRAVLCAVQTTLRPLLERGIVPDFATSLDFHEMSRKFFEDVGDLTRTHLVAEPKATWHVIDHYPGPVSLLDNAWARSLIGDELAARGGLKPGATVSHLAFYLAVYMGCDPIVFVGQDLGYTGHVFYVPGVEIHRAWRSELNRFHTMEQKEWERIVRNREILHRVPGIDGGEVYTDELLLTYLEQFQNDIAAEPRRVINATEGGAHLRGTEVLCLSEVAEQYCHRKIDPDLFACPKNEECHDGTRLSATKRQLEHRIDELGGVIEMCDELLGLLRELDNLTDDPQQFNRRIVRVDELRTRIQQQSRGYKIVNSFTQFAELRRFSADRRIKAAENDDAERARQQIARDIDFISGVREGAQELSPILRRALDRVSRARVPS